MRAACERIRLAVERGERICVHGDYDVDGICATALAVLTLRELGAEVEWHLPSRFDEGYGVSSTTIARLAGEGCALVVTVDCGITAVEEVARGAARSASTSSSPTTTGPGDGAARLPGRRDAAVGVPVPRALRHRRRREARRGAARRRERGRTPHLDLVALATIADVVPLARREPRRSRSPACARSRRRGSRASAR